MKRKLLSLVVVFALLSQTLVSAGTIHDLLKGNPSALGDSSDPFYDREVGIFYWSKFQDTDSTKPNGGVVTAQLTGGVRPAGSGIYSYSTTAQNFDYKVSIDMSNVKATFNTLHTYAYAAVSSNAALKTAFDNSFVKGKFDISITYDSAAITAPTFTSGNVKYVSDDSVATIYTIEFASIDSTSTPGTVIIPVTANTTVDALYTTPSLLDDIYLDLGNWMASVNDSTITASMTGYTMIADDNTPSPYVAANDDYAQIDYTSAPSNVLVYQSTSSGGGGGRGRDKEEDDTEPDDTELGENEEDITKDVTVKGSKGSKKLNVKVIKNTETGEVEVTIEGGEEDETFDVNLNKNVVDPDDKEGFAPNGYSETPYAGGDDDYDGTVTVPGGTTKLYPRYVNVTTPRKASGVEVDADGKGTHKLYIVGYPDGEVKPNNNITREEVAAVFYRLLDTDYRATIESTDHQFPDVEQERWSNGSIATMAKGKFIVGDNFGLFNPANPITRAEFATIASKFAPEGAEPAKEVFTDIADHWAKDYILTVAGQYWISGYGDGSFKPDAYITRAEAMAIINRMLVRYGDVNSEYAKQWPDVSHDDWYYRNVIEATTSHTFVRGTDGWKETWIAAE